MPKASSNEALSDAVSGAPPDCAMRSDGVRSDWPCVRLHSITFAYMAGTPCSTVSCSSTSVRASFSGRKRGS
ncbi:hypothetical protein D3C85_1373850 [compost metagenome]